MSLTIEVAKNENAVILGLAGQIDEITVSQLRRECTSWILQGEKTILLDFAAVQLVSSLGVHAILMAGKQIEQAGGSLKLCGFHGQVQRTFQFSGLAAMFSTYETREEWLATPVPAPLELVYNRPAEPWGWVVAKTSTPEAELQSQVNLTGCTPVHNLLHSVIPNHLPKIASEDNSIGSWLVRAFTHPVACLDFCASWCRRLSTMELTLSKR